MLPPLGASVHPTSRELDSIRSLLQDNGESPLSLLLQDAISNDPTPVGGMRGSAEVWPQPPPQEAMTALVGLLRAKDRDSMQMSILQLHRSLASSIQDTVADPNQIDGAPPLPALSLGIGDGLLSPVALSALLTPSGCGFSVEP